MLIVEKVEYVRNTTDKQGKAKSVHKLITEESILSFSVFSSVCVFYIFIWVHALYLWFSNFNLYQSHQASKSCIAVGSLEESLIQLGRLGLGMSISTKFLGAAAACPGTTLWDPWLCGVWITSYGIRGITLLENIFSQGCIIFHYMIC